jgi:hypothetical protein
VLLVYDTVIVGNTSHQNSELLNNKSCTRTLQLVDLSGPLDHLRMIIPGQVVLSLRCFIVK